MEGLKKQLIAVMARGVFTDLSISNQRRLAVNLPFRYYSCFCGLHGGLNDQPSSTPTNWRRGDKKVFQAEDCVAISLMLTKINPVRSPPGHSPIATPSNRISDDITLSHP